MDMFPHTMHVECVVEIQKYNFEIVQFYKASDGFQFVNNGPDFRNKKPWIGYINRTIKF